MKNKIQKLAAVLILTILGSTNSFAGDTYADRGALIGGATLGVAGVIIMGRSFFCITSSGDGCDNSFSAKYGLRDALIGGAAGLGIGAGIGALIGWGIRKEPKVFVAPLFIQSKTQGNTTGGSVAFHF